MPLPNSLQLGIDRELTTLELRSEARTRLSRAAVEISDRYQRGQFTGALASPEARAAYLLTRLPATFAANVYVFCELAQLVPELAPLTLLDIGSGPGTSMWAAREIWPALRNHTLVESNRDFQQLGARLAAPIENVNWIAADAGSLSELPPADLVVLSYSLGEFKSPQKIVERAWCAANQALIIIDPGTPKNFSLLAAVRTHLIAAGANLVAPCPHPNACPMESRSDWCHFAVRVERSAEHRRLKRATLGYEDEKFSYLVFSKTPANHAEARIVRHPAIHSGHIQLTLCTAEGLVSSTVTRSNKPAFRDARKAQWGDPWPPSDLPR